MSQPFVTSVRVERSSGPHEYVSVWLRGQNVGTLCVGKGDGEALRRLLLAETVFGGVKAWQDAGCPAWPAAVDNELDGSLHHAAELQREARETLAGLPPGMTVRMATNAEQLAALRDYVAPGGSACLAGEALEAQRDAKRTMAAERVPFVMKGALSAAPRLRPDGPWSTRERVEWDRSQPYLTPTFSPEMPPGWQVVTGIDWGAENAAILAQDHPTAETGHGAPAPSPPAANEPPAAGAPPTSKCRGCGRESWQEHEAGCRR